MQAQPGRRRAIWAAQAAVANAVKQANTIGLEIYHEKNEARKNADAETKADALHVNPDTCPKCGRKGRRGMNVHIKYCSG